MTASHANLCLGTFIDESFDQINVLSSEFRLSRQELKDSLCISAGQLRHKAEGVESVSPVGPQEIERPLHYMTHRSTESSVAASVVVLCATTRAS